MTHRTFVFLILALLVSAPAVMAQEEVQATAPPAPDLEGAVQVPVPGEEALTYDDYTVKGYSLTFFAGQSNGAKYLENMDLSERTILTPEEAAIMGFDGETLRVSLDQDHYTGAHKEIQPGPAYGGRIGIYISDDFHLDLLGTFAKGEVVTTMTYYPDGISDDPAAKSSRIEVDRDPSYQMIKGGLSLMYDATPAKFFGLVPRLGFGLGGIINRFSYLPDVTGLYLEGNLGLNFKVVNNLQFGGQIDFSNFAFEVDELGYSNVVNYLTYSLGITYFFDSLPQDVRAAHEAEKE